MKDAALSDLLGQMKITNRLLAAQLRGSMGQKELVGLLVSTGATYGSIAEVLGTSEATVEVTARRLRNEEKRNKKNATPKKARARRSGRNNG